MTTTAMMYKYTGSLRYDESGIWLLEWDEGCGVEAEFSRRHLAVQFAERRWIRIEAP